MALMKNSRHVLAALVLLIVATAAGIGRGAEVANTPANVDAAKAVVFGIVPCSTGSSINVATAPPFPNADLQLQCGTPALSSSSSSKPAANNITDREERRLQSSRRTAGPSAVSAAGVTVWANARAGVNGEFAISLGVIRNSTSVGGLLPSMLLANQCSVVVTTPLAACDVSLAGVTGTLSAAVEVLGRPIIGGLIGFAAAPFSVV